ncbi:MAG TPA: hypothetical protein VE476_11145 [Propionibacteriaceae bacterium]|jgi:hypothetical protein|nr:hypothetical protein [Propionibacteriaceae bacterium]
MSFKQCAAVLVGLVGMLKDPPPRDERGLSQSAETAIIVAGAVAIALVVVGLIRAFVVSELGKI